MNNARRNVTIGLISAAVVTLGLAIPAAMRLDKTKTTPLPTSAISIKVTRTITRTASWTSSPTSSFTPSPFSSPTASATNTGSETPTPSSTATNTPSPTVSATYTPHVDSIACPNHDNHTYHALWDAVNNCHHDHEHGDNPFTQAVVDAFPGFDLQALLGGVEIGHTNPSSPMENTMKHGGFKWQVQPQTPHGCNNNGFQGAQYGVDGAVIQYHGFGDYGVEMETRIHSAVLLVRVCDASNLSDKGYMYVVQLQDYGQRVIPYQGTVMAYPDTPSPAYQSALGPYFTDDCVGAVLQCRSSLAFVINRNLFTNSIWGSEPTGFNSAYPGDSLFKLLFRVRDTYQLFDWSIQTYPFRFLFVCSSDGGLTYNGHMPGCVWNNSTTRVHQIIGMVPSAWDNLAGFDTNPTVGRITADGYVDRYGRDVNLACTAPSPDCYPIKMIDMYVGVYGDELTAEKVSNPTVISNPERDVYFCLAVVCSETTAGAQPSGWIGAEN